MENWANLEPFNQWYDEDGFTFHTQRRVSYTQCGMDNALSLFEFLKLTTDISSEDIRKRGTSMQFLVEHGFARVVARSSFRFHRMPLVNERIEIVTVEEKPEPLQFVRSYQFKDEAGNVLVSGNSKWLLTDFATRRIRPVKAIEPYRKLNTVSLEHDCLPCGKIPEPGDMVKIGERQVHRSNIDGNHHTDNAVYGAFIVDSLPEAWANKPIKDFRINYSREALLGEFLELYMAESGENRIVVIGKKANEVSFASELSF